MQHRQNRRRSDPGAEQHHRPLARLQNESTARRADVERVTDSDMLPEKISSHSIRLDLHADAITLRRYWPRKRVTPKQRRAACCVKTQDHVLARERRAQR